MHVFYRIKYIISLFLTPTHRKNIKDKITIVLCIFENPCIRKHHLKHFFLFY